MGAPENAPRRLRPGSIRVGRLVGVPIYLTLSWLVLAVLVIGGFGRVAATQGRSGAVTALLGATVVGSLLLSVLLHELAHALVAKRLSVGVRGITLELLGGFTELEREAPAPGPEAAIALAGPAVSLLLGGVAAIFVPITDRGTLPGEFVFLVAASNLIVGVFNLLPGLPLDGGRALRAGIWRLTGDPRKADLVAGWAGRLIAALTMAGAFALYLNGAISGLLSILFAVLIGVTLWSGASEAIRLSELRRRLPGIAAGELVRPLHVVASGTPLAEALRQRDELGNRRSLGVADSAGRLIALVNPRRVAAVPLERRPWVDVDSVANTIAPAQRIAAETTGMEVLDAVNANPGHDLLVTVGEDVIGVLRAADVISMLESKEKR